MTEDAGKGKSELVLLVNLIRKQLLDAGVAEDIATQVMAQLTPTIARLAAVEAQSVIADILSELGYHDRGVMRRALAAAMRRRDKKVGA